MGQAGFASGPPDSEAKAITARLHGLGVWKKAFLEGKKYILKKILPLILGSLFYLVDTIHIGKYQRNVKRERGRVWQLLRSE